MDKRLNTIKKQLAQYRKHYSEWCRGNAYCPVLGEYFEHGDVEYLLALAESKLLERDHKGGKDEGSARG